MAATSVEALEKRRIFGIISHPDAGKTTLTEKLLYHGGAIREAGSVKARKTGKAAKSDWMEIEKERGISVTSSVLQFEYDGKVVSIMDTPGHNDFGEDTYRILTSVDSAVMVIDAAKGVEAQTKKLFKVCSMRGIPIFTFINKLDRQAKDPLELLEDLEEALGLPSVAVTWPIGSGQLFEGVYNRMENCVLLYRSNEVIELGEDGVFGKELEGRISDANLDILRGEIELVDGAGNEFDKEAVDAGKLSPVFFGSALNTFGIDMFLNYFLKMTTPPLGRMSDQGVIDPVTEPFSAFVFKIQANMNKAHRDRIAFMRICSGKFEAGMEVYHAASKRKLKLSQPQQLMAQDRKIVEEAYAGDVIGVFDPGLFSIGDTLTFPGKKFQYEGIPTFAPEHFCRVVQMNTMKRKQFVQGVTQIAQEGAIQIFQEFTAGLSEIIVGVVGVLQFDVLKYRLENEYGCEIRLEPIPYNYIRWVKDPSTDLTKLKRVSDVKKVKDMKGNPLLLFANEWVINQVLEHNEGLELLEFRKN